MTVSVRPIEGRDRDWIRDILRQRWGGATMASDASTNDNERALAWYRKRGFSVVEVPRGEMELERGL